MLGSLYETQARLPFGLSGGDNSSLLAVGPLAVRTRTGYSALLNQLFVNRISAFFGTDVFVSAAVVFVFVSFERVHLGNKWWLPVVAVLVVGVSLGLPLLLYLREGGTESAITAAS